MPALMMSLAKRNRVHVIYSMAMAQDVVNSGRRSRITLHVAHATSELQNLIHPIALCYRRDAHIFLTVSRTRTGLKRHNLQLSCRAVYFPCCSWQYSRAFWRFQLMCIPSLPQPSGSVAARYASRGVLPQYGIHVPVQAIQFSQHQRLVRGSRNTVRPWMCTVLSIALPLVDERA